MGGVTFGTMQSSRILWSDKYAHDVRLTEQEIGVILHALYALSAAFSMELDYLKLIEDVRRHLDKTTREEAIQL